MFSRLQNLILGGTFITQNRTSRGMDILLEWVATSAFHNSDELYDAPKCHPHTRVAVLDDIMKWVNEAESPRDEFILWLFGPAGAGKSAIAKKIAEIAAERDLLIADFFFSRTSLTRGTKDRLIATLAYQLATSVPGTRSYIEDAIERDPVIFNKNILTQIDTLLIKPFLSISSTQVVPSRKLIIIDGLDECNDSRAQIAILEAISRSFTSYQLYSFSSVHRRLALDDTYQPDDDIRRFFSDKFEHINRAHLLRSTIPINWPAQELLDTLVRKSSGQFIYAATVVKFVESSCHRPSARLNIILGVSPPGKTNPFAELDALYNHLLSSIDDVQITLRVLSLYVMTPKFASIFRYSSMSPELFLSLEPGDIPLSLINLSSIVTYDKSSRAINILHASLVDFLSDKSRSTVFYIDTARICTDFVHRILQYVKGPDGIQAGDIRLFRGVFHLFPSVLEDQLWNDILNFDLDAFINLSIRRYCTEHPLPLSGSTITTFWMWKRFLNDAGVEDGEKKKALDSTNLLIRGYKYINLTGNYNYYSLWRFVDILLEMDDHNLHLVDQDALDLRHAYMTPLSRLIGMISRYVDGVIYASAALHCMRFLYNPPKYSEKNEYPESGLIFAEWKATCGVTLEMFCKLLQQANSSLELVQFISNHDIHPTVQKFFFANRILEVNVHILAFLGRESACPNWRIISAIQQRSPIITHQKPSEYSAMSNGDEERKTTQYLIRHRLDQCCSTVH